MDPFNSLSIPIFSTADLKNYTRSNLLTRQNLKWDSKAFVENYVHKKRSINIATIDGGGSKITFAISHISPNLKITHRVIETFISPGGLNFVNKMLAFKKSLSDYAVKTIGISFGGLMKESKFLGSDYLIPFYNDFKKFNHDFADLFKGFRVSVLNDAVAVNIGMSTHIRNYQRKKKVMENFSAAKINNLLVLIMGGGMGGGVMKDLETIYETEPGHVEAGSLNQYNITQTCQMWNDGRICQQDACGGSVSFVDKVVSSHLKRKIDGKQAARLLLEGNDYVKKIYHTAASCYARTFIGMAKLFKLAGSATLYVLHGGGSKTFGFTSHVQKITEKNVKNKLFFINTSSLSKNICLDGAAFYAASFVQS